MAARPRPSTMREKPQDVEAVLSLLLHNDERGMTMPDIPKVGLRHCKRVDVNHPYGLWYWSERFDVSKEGLKHAVEKAWALWLTTWRRSWGRSGEQTHRNVHHTIRPPANVAVTAATGTGTCPVGRQSACSRSGGSRKRR